MTQEHATRLYSNTMLGTKGFLTRPLSDRIMEKTEVDPDTNCWNWMGSNTGNGYGLIWRDGRNVVAHRASYELWREQVPVGFELDHLCENKKCVNPDHLEIVTHSENLLRAYKVKKTHCKRGHQMTSDNTYVRKDGSHECRICQNNRHLLFRIKRRAAIKAAKEG